MRFPKYPVNRGTFVTVDSVAGPPMLVGRGVATLTFLRTEPNRWLRVHFPRQGFGPDQEM
jgi:hypothetical protein